MSDISQLIALSPKLPDDAAELARCLSDPRWRIFSGALYKIMIKGDNGETETVLPFVPNAAQRQFIDAL